MPRKNHSKSRKVFITQAKLIDPHEYKKWLFILENVKKKLDVIFNEPFHSPTLLVMGDQDHAFLSDSKKYCKMHPQTKLEIIKHCGHVSNIEKYQLFNAFTLDFFARNNQ